ncbi:MAG: helix-turn-helix domain-containing protein [Bacillota bacterium]
MTKTIIGKNIKLLRTTKGLTQEKLANMLSISTQSVSKWERFETTPDIMILPQLSTIFGITIDTLFTQSLEDDLTKIDNMLDYQDDITALDESYIIQKLEHLENKAVSRLKAKLYLKRSLVYKKLAKKFSEKALSIEPNNKENHYLYLSSVSGVMTDWNAFNKHEIIAYYQAFVKKHPHNPKGYMHLLDHLIHDKRIGEAKTVLTKYKSLDTSLRYEWYQARINQVNLGIDPLINAFKGDWLAWNIKADEYAKVAQYDEAMTAYQKAYDLQPSPKYIDALESMAHIYTITKQDALAKQMYAKIVNTLKTEWHITHGSAVQYYLKKSIACK